MHQGNGFSSRHIEAAGLRTHFIEAGSGPTLVLIHGGGAGADSIGNWGHLFPALADHYHVIAVDMPGFGNTQKPDAESDLYTQAGRNAWLADFLGKISSSPRFVVGNSMGGATALGVSMRRPELISRMVLMGSAGLKPQQEPSEALKTVMNYDYTYEGMRRVVEALTGPDFVADERIIQYRYELVTRSENKQGLQNVQVRTRATGGLAYADEDVARVKVPTLLLWGKSDQCVPITHAFRFLELMDLSWGHIVPRCGHWLMIEKPREFVSALHGFLTATEVAAS